MKRDLLDLKDRAYTMTFVCIRNSILAAFGARARVALVASPTRPRRVHGVRYFPSQILRCGLTVFCVFLPFVFFPEIPQKTEVSNASATKKNH